MLLYHGTNERSARLALADGLKPRGRSKRGNWNHTITSNQATVYLTDCYAGYFAMVATKDGERMALMEIDTDLLDASLFRPDEDVLEQGSRGTGEITHAKMIQRTMNFRARLDDYAHLGHHREHLGEDVLRAVDRRPGDTASLAARPVDGIAHPVLGAHV